MTIAPQSFALVVSVAFVIGLLCGGILSLAFAMHVTKNTEGVGYDR